MTLAGNGWATYTPKPGYAGPDSFWYEVTDGELARVAKVSIIVQAPLQFEGGVLGGGTIELGGLVGRNPLEGPYQVVIDKAPELGTVRTVPGEDRIWYAAPVVKKPTTVEIAYTVRSMTEDRTSPSYGQAVSGTIRIKITTK